MKIAKFEGMAFMNLNLSKTNKKHRQNRLWPVHPNVGRNIQQHMKFAVQISPLLNFIFNTNFINSMCTQNKKSAAYYSSQAFEMNFLKFTEEITNVVLASTSFCHTSILHYVWMI